MHLYDTPNVDGFFFFCTGPIVITVSLETFNFKRLLSYCYLGLITNQVNPDQLLITKNIPLILLHTHIHIILI